MALDISASVLPPPDGMASNFHDPPSKNNALGLGAVSLMLVVSTLAVAARLYGRFVIVRQLKAEDILVVCAYGVFIAAVWADLMWLQYPGYFVHAWDITVETEIWHCMKNYFWWGSMFIVVLQSLVLVVITILLNVQCIPHEAIWDVTKVANAKYFPLPILQKFSASTHFVTDVIMVLLPQKVVWSLNLSLQKKVGLAFVLSLGLLGDGVRFHRSLCPQYAAYRQGIVSSPKGLWQYPVGHRAQSSPRRPRSSYNVLPLKRNKDSVFDDTETGVPPDKLDRSESMDRLRETSKDGDAGFGGGIIPTTHVTVVQDKECRNLGQSQVASAWA
ncbi:hypothetical protein PG994_009341 [Apiospora phragmitis]|uniref:Rhodopsin domain-containing protein n=1 Tax=Apiospora phragmitis TaxID=2905665 RepID=A0ABR1ULW4_9PEZI